MIALDVDLNGERLCRAGLGDAGVLDAMVSWIKADPDRVCQPGRHYLGTPRESLALSVGGLAQNEFRYWLKRELAVGDVVQIRIADVEAADEPASREPDTVADTAFFASQQNHKDHLLAELAELERQMAEAGVPQRCTFCRRPTSRERRVVAAPEGRANICHDCATVVIDTLSK